MDTHWGKYQGPLAAVTERWILDGDRGDEEYSDGDIGEGTVLWRGPFTLSWDEGRYLMGEDFECTLEEVDELAKLMAGAQGIVHDWDSQGFLYGWALETQDAVREQVEAIRASERDVRRGRRGDSAGTAPRGEGAGTMKLPYEETENDRYEPTRTYPNGWRITLAQDDDPSSPREWDHLGTMACWHRGYELGDKQVRTAVEDYGLEALLEELRGGRCAGSSGRKQPQA